MIAKRILQLVVHSAIFIACIKLNWIILRRYNFILRLPETSPLHYAFIALVPVIVCFAGSLRFHYDDHLSSYDLYADLPNASWLPDSIIPLDVGIVGSLVGMYMFIFYIFAATLLFTLHTLGLFSESTPANARPISRTLLSFQVVTGIAQVSFVLLLLYHFFLMIFRFLQDLEFDPGLLNTSNLERHFFNAVNLTLLAWYATWVLSDSFHLWRWNSAPPPGSSYSPTPINETPAPPAPQSQYR